jgi:hypothetical protein
MFDAGFKAVVSLSKIRDLLLEFFDGWFDLSRLLLSCAFDSISLVRGMGKKQDLLRKLGDRTRAHNVWASMISVPDSRSPGLRSNRVFRQIGHVPVVGLHPFCSFSSILLSLVELQHYQ